MSVKSILDVQVGKESTWGTSVAATARLMGIRNVTLKPLQDAGILPELRATLMPGYTGVVRSIEGAADLEFTAGYEDIEYYLEACFGEQTPSGGGPYVYAGGAPSTTPTLRKQTLYYGDSTGTYKLLGAIGSQLTLKGESHAELMGTVAFVGKNVTTGTLASLNDRTFTPIMGNQAALYMDAWGGTVGTTALTNIAYAFELSFKLGTEPLVRHFNGGLTPTSYAYRAPSPENCTLKLSLEFAATSKTEVDSIIGGTLNQKQFRIKYTTGSSQIAQFDFAGSLVKPVDSIFSERNGIAAVDLEYQGTYNSTLGNFFKWSITNSVSALP